ncbi:MAG: isocitrate lyase/PEP mutase family protein [Bryobacterales bacterium]|nr:isocitrate lyase/PEP mutase family protein [Bryobacterales bacterium]
MSNKTSRREFLGTAGIAAAGVVVPQAPANSTASKAARLRQLLRRPEPFYCIAAFDSPSARLVELAGFDSIYAGGSLMAMEHGLPDWGLTSTVELLEFATRLTRNVDIPVIGDCDNGGGNPVSVYRATKDFERAGLAGILFEDRIRVERIGQKADVISTAQMVDRIKAAVDARSEMIIVGRTDALAAGKTLEEAIDRGKAYAEAGADAILFPGVQPLETTRRTIAAISKTIFAQMGPDVPVSEAIKAGVHVLFYTSMVQDIALAAYLQALTELKTTGMMPKTFNSHRLPNDVTAKLERSAEILARAKKYKLAP